MDDEAYDLNAREIMEKALTEVARLRETQVLGWEDGERLVAMAKALCGWDEEDQEYPYVTMRMGQKGHHHLTCNQVVGTLCVNTSWMLPKWWHFLSEARMALECADTLKEAASKQTTRIIVDDPHAPLSPEQEARHRALVRQWFKEISASRETKIDHMAAVRDIAKGD